MASAHQRNSLDEKEPDHSQEAISPQNHAPLQQSGSASYPTQSFRRRLLSPHTLKPAGVLVVHTLLLVFSWTFFATTVKKPKAMPVLLAIEAKYNPQSVVWVTSTVAAGLAIVSSLLYTLAIKYLLAGFLAERVSLFAIASAVQLSQKSLIMNFKRPWWTIGAALSLLAVNQQVPGWSALLIPKPIEIRSPMSGHELDLTSTAFQNVWAINGPHIDTDIPSLVISMTQASGSAAVESLFTPSLLNFNYFYYNNSTMGIMPVSTEVIGNITSITGKTGLPVRTVVRKVAETPPGFPASFRLTQQGFTAHVTCQQLTLDNTTQPSLVFHSQNVSLPSGTTAMSAQLEVRCAGATNSTLSAPVLTSDNIDAVLGFSCPVNQTGESQRWDLILFGSGTYSQSIGTTVCSVSPEINTVNVFYYGNDTTPSNPAPNFVYSSQPWGGQDAPWLGDFCLSTFLQGLEVAQSSTGNLMGDTVRSFLTNGSGPNAQEILAQYIRGVAEVSVTLLRTAYTDTNILDPGGSAGIPTNMRSNINGTYWAGTMGWQQSLGTASGVILAPTFVSIMSILITIVTLMKKGDAEPEINRYFDPGDLINVISAASARGVSKVDFQTGDEKTAKYSNAVRLTLAHGGELDTKSGSISDKT